MKQRGRVVAIGRLAGQQFEMGLAVCMLLFSFILFKKSPLGSGLGICLHFADA
jgi:hypothetical protein